jgi:hypothetical protein
MSATNEFIPTTLVNQDLERLKFAQNLRRNPADYSAYVNERVDGMTDEVFNKKRAAFQKAQIDLGRYMDMDHNANFYKARSGDVDRLSDVIGANNKRIEQNLNADKDISKRQFEINEWYNYNKLETLFFLQVFFISSLCMAIIIYLQKNSTITNAVASLLSGALMLIVVGLGVYRYYYTKRTRDQRLWHRRYFGTAKAPKPAKLCSKGGEIDMDINSIVPKSVTECADDAAQRFSSWQDSIEKEMMAYQETGASPSGINGQKGIGGLVCDNLA